MDGEWEAPLVPNPACEEVSGCGPWSPPLINNPEYKGKWVPPLIDNPNYKGVWTPRKIPNPDYFEDKNPFQMSSIVSLVTKYFVFIKSHTFSCRCLNLLKVKGQKSNHFYLD